MKKKIRLKILLVLIIILGIVFINYKRDKTYVFKLPNYDKVVSIGIENKTKNRLISNKKEIKNIYNIFKDEYRTRRTKNSKDGYATNKIKMNFYYEDNIATIIYLYKFKDKYYLEQVNNGIYLIDEDIYQSIEKYFE